VNGSVDSLAFARRLTEILREHENFRKHIVPLCAAETPVSDFVRSFLADPIHEKYAMGGPLRPVSDNFIGAEHVLDLHQLTIELCGDVFGAFYADPRPLSGTSAITNLLMTLSKPGQRVLLQTSASGGHSSMAHICRRLGLEILDLPYDYARFQVDVERAQELVRKETVEFVLLAPADILYAPCIEAVGFDDATTVIYDATQTLGLIASGHLSSPLDTHPRLVVSGGTHKTLPGPSSGLILTNNREIAETLDAELSPKYVRHSHPHHMAALCATLIEQQAIGRKYSHKIRDHAATLTLALQEHGVEVLQDGDRVTETHQVFLTLPAAHLDDVYRRALGAGITLNLKRRRLFRDAGLRLGVQEIARYVWTAADVKLLGSLIAKLLEQDVEVSCLRGKVRRLATLNRFSREMTFVPS
jgi:glycine hydroxymethyltransferase